MHPEVSEVVSQYQYGGQLQTRRGVIAVAPFDPPGSSRASPRADLVCPRRGQGRPSLIRAERGPGNRSWVRPETRDVLEKLFSDPRGPGIRRALHLAVRRPGEGHRVRSSRRRGYDPWTASTVHSQQGTEADLVIFDTVNASSTSWPLHEWLRLVNVGLSRAGEFVILIASRAEMQAPFLNPLAEVARARVLNRVGSVWRWSEVSAKCDVRGPATRSRPTRTCSAVRSQTQVAAAGHELRPAAALRLQHGRQAPPGPRRRRERQDAGPGPLAPQDSRSDRRPARRQDLGRLRQPSPATAPDRDDRRRRGRTTKAMQPFPLASRGVAPVHDLLDLLLREVGKNMRQFEFDYDQAARSLSESDDRRDDHARCHALFADEGQDLGPNTLKLLTALVEHGDPDDPKSRSVNIFYDNAQNIYGRSTPKWSEMGLDMRGRSTVMKESFPVHQADHRVLPSTSCTGCIPTRRTAPTTRNWSRWGSSSRANARGPLVERPLHSDRGAGADLREVPQQGGRVRDDRRPAHPLDQG